LLDAAERGGDLEAVRRQMILALLLDGKLDAGRLCRSMDDQLSRLKMRAQWKLGRAARRGQTRATRTLGRRNLCPWVSRIHHQLDLKSSPPNREPAHTSGSHRRVG
jgi:hypothetical protein